MQYTLVFSETSPINCPKVHLYHHGTLTSSWYLYQNVKLVLPWYAYIAMVLGLKWYTYITYTKNSILKLSLYT